MNIRGFVVAFPAAVVLSALCGCSTPAAQAVKDYAIQTIPLAQVEITDQFWAPKIEVNRTVSIQHLFKKYEERGRVDAGRVVEAAAYMLSARRDPELERYVDRLIDDAVAGVEKRLASPTATPLISGYFLEAAVA